MDTTAINKMMGTQDVVGTSQQSGYEVIRQFAKSKATTVQNNPKDFVEDENEIIFFVSVTGIEEKDLQLWVDEEARNVEIDGVSTDSYGKDWSLEKVVHLPRKYDLQKLTAQLRNGVLYLVAPTCPEACKRRELKIQK